MFRKYIFILFVSCILCVTPIMNAVANNFDPETVNFSQMKTIKTWIADRYHPDLRFMRTVQDYVGELILENPRHEEFIKRASYTDKFGDVYMFGASTGTQEAIELPFLQYVKEISKHKEVTTLEIAAGVGSVSWKVPLTFGKKGTHYVNDLVHSRIIKKRISSRLARLKKAMQAPKTNFMKSIKIKIMPGNCFDILDKHPELKGKIDVIYVQNLEHFLNPIEHQKFLTLIGELLAPDGYAFLYASINLQLGRSSNDIIDYEKAVLSLDEAPGMYAGFLGYDYSAKHRHDLGLYDIHYSDAKRPKNDNVKCNEKIYDSREEGDVLIAKVYAISNGFTPEIYKKAISLHDDLEIIDSYFVNRMGFRVERKLEKKNHVATWAAVAIVRKRSTAEAEYLEL